jgi:3-dehydroquinate synthase
LAVALFRHYLFHRQHPAARDGMEIYPNLFLLKQTHVLALKAQPICSAKNILGTFNPPDEILVCSKFLDSSNQRYFLSGVGEIIKVHAIAGSASFYQLAQDYDAMLQIETRCCNVRSSRDKEKYIEADEFDRGIVIIQLWHSFGHAIESATNFAIPHGIAVSMGMDMANRIATLRGLLSADNFDRMHDVLRKNYAEYTKTPIPVNSLLSALMKDKKTTATKLVLIFPLGNEAKIERVQVDADETFRLQCETFLAEMAA